MTNYEKLRAKLTELFQLDKADLDFGIYRIMNSKRDEILRFLDNDLLPQVKQVLQQAQGEQSSAGADELKQAEDNARRLGMNPDDVPLVCELRAKYNAGPDIAALEQEVFNHLYNFFRRYYDEGDFLSLRRYKEGVYAIPYEGEEVKLHWANADQYYIKTAEHFRDYCFLLPSPSGRGAGGEGDGGKGARVHFKLVDAQTERDNNKEKEKRVFILVEENPVTEEDGELTIRFEYRNDSQKRKQKDLNEAAEQMILDSAPDEWKSRLRDRAPTEANPNRTLLAKHLTGYTARNTFDYFIHKNLGKFLRQELDFYIKNEVMHLDDIENEKAPKVEQYLAKVRAIRRVADKIITFLAQLEDFQKRLWLKAPFVVSTDFLIPLPLVPDQLRSSVLSSDTQLRVWEELLKAHPTEVTDRLPGLDIGDPLLRFLVDTRLLSERHKQELLAAIPDPDEATRFTFVNADCFRGLNLLEARYREQIRCIYIDPPYNKGGGDFAYKDNYQHSSWLSMVRDRLNLGRRCWSTTGTGFCSLDDNESFNFVALLSHIMKPGGVKVLPAITNLKGNQDTEGFVSTHEYVISFANTQLSDIGRLPVDESLVLEDWSSDEYGLWKRADNLRATGENAPRDRRPRLWYPIFVDGDSDSLYVTEDDQPLSPNHVTLLPVNEDGVELSWYWSKDKVRTEPHNLILVNGRTGFSIYKKQRPKIGDLPTSKPKSFLYAAEYSSTSGTALMKNLFGERFGAFTPKPVAMIRDLVILGSCERDIVLDFYAGTGTTAHAVIEAERIEQGNRKCILMEMGSQIDEVLLPRFQKIVYSRDWREGSPSQLGQPVYALTKVLRLESFEDTLANISVAALHETQTRLIESSEVIREDYMLRYVLNAEATGSPSLLNIQAFNHPFDYKLNIAADTVGETKEVNVDLLETFNWLLGLRVNTIEMPQRFDASFKRIDKDGKTVDTGKIIVDGRLRPSAEGKWLIRCVTGRLPGPGNSDNGEKALIIWRDLPGNPEEDNAVLDAFCQTVDIRTLDGEFAVIYVNGDNNLQNLRKDDQTWKVRLIEEEFHRLMWDVEDV